MIEQNEYQGFLKNKDGTVYWQVKDPATFEKYFGKPAWTAIEKWNPCSPVSDCSNIQKQLDLATQNVDKLTEENKSQYKAMIAMQDQIDKLTNQLSAKDGEITWGEIFQSVWSKIKDIVIVKK